MVNEEQLSKFCHVIEVEKGEVYAIYNSLWLRTIFVEAELLPLLTKLQLGSGSHQATAILPTVLQTEGYKLIEQLRREKFLAPVDDENKLAELREEIDRLPINLMYLIVSLNCNLACSYCYLAKALWPKDQADMSIMTARRGIDLFAELVDQQGVGKPQLILYGGEPLVNLPTLRFALEYGTKRLPGIEFVLNTNGTLITNDIAQLLATHHVEVAVSIDGLKEAHNRYRIDRRGKGSFDKAIAGYKILQEHGVEVGISCTITPANVEQLTETIQWFISELGIQSLGFNLMIGMFETLESMADYSAKAARVLIDCFKIARKAGVYEDRMMRRVKAIAEGNVCFNDCGGCGQQIVITPSNTIGVCQAFLNTGENFLPLDDMPNPLEHELWSKWRQRSPFNMPACLECEALSMCGGGCPYNSLLRTGNLMDPDLVHCIHAKEALSFLMRDLWQQVNADTT